jgi:hypothetical protein
MISKRVEEIEQISAYLSRAAERRAKSKLHTSMHESAPGVVAVGGTVSVTLAPNAKSISLMGGATKVFGQSKFSIPEYKRRQKSD